MPVNPTGDPYDPPGAPINPWQPTGPDPAAGAGVGKLAQGPMPGTGGTQPQSAEEHAANKQGWLEFFRNPAVATGLLQFSANILQPRYHQSELGMIGQSLGAAGEAVGRQKETEMTQQKQQSQTELEEAQAGYYKQRAPLELEKLQNAQDVQNARIELQRQLDLARESKDASQVQLIQSQMQMLDMKEQQLKQTGTDPSQLRTKYAEIMSQWDTLNSGASPADRQKYADQVWADLNRGVSTGAPGTDVTTSTAAPTQQLVPPANLHDPAVIQQLANLTPAQVSSQLALYRQQFGDAGAVAFNTAYHDALRAGKPKADTGRPPVAAGQPDTSTSYSPPPARP